MGNKNHSFEQAKFFVRNLSGLKNLRWNYFVSLVLHSMFMARKTALK